MTEEKTIDKENKVTKTSEKVMSSEERQRYINKLNGNTRDLKVENIECIEFQCSRNGTDRYDVNLYNPNLELNIDIQKVLPQEKAVEFVENYQQGQKVHVTLANILIADKTFTYICDINLDKQESQSEYQILKSLKSRQNISFSITDNGRKLIYGSEQKIRKYLPDKLDTQSIRADKTNDKVIMIMAILMFGIYAFSGTAFSIFLILFSLLLVFIGYLFSTNTSQMYKTSIDPDRIVGEEFATMDVFEGKFEHNEEHLKIWSEREDKKIEWTFEKDEIGNLPKEGRKALENIRRFGSNNKCMIPVKKPDVTDEGHIVSDNGEYSILT